MPIEDVRSQIIVAQHELNVASYHCNQEAAFTEEAIEAGAAAVPELKAITHGVGLYTAGMGELLRMCNPLQTHVDSPTRFVEVREEIMINGGSALRYLGTVIEKVVAYNEAHGEVNSQAELAGDRINDARDAISKVGGDSFFEILEKFEEIIDNSAEHCGSLYHAKDFICEQYDNDKDDPDERDDALQLRMLTYHLTEGIYYLSKTATNDDAERAQCVLRASIAVGEDHTAYLNSFIERVGNGIVASSLCLEKCNEINKLIRSIVEDSDKLLREL